MNMLLASAAVAALVFVPSAAAAQSEPCPVVSTAVVSGALDTPVSAKAQPGMPAGFDLCEFLDPSGTDFGVSREANVFGTGSPGGAAALARRYIPNLPDEARNQIDALSAVGINVAVPGYEISAVSGVGDAALWVRTELVPGFFKDSLLVQRGSDAYSFDVDDSPTAQDKLTTLAQAVLAAQAP